jgi:hypothetical protein
LATLIGEQSCVVASSKKAEALSPEIFVSAGKAELQPCRSCEALEFSIQEGTQNFISIVRNLLTCAQTLRPSKADFVSFFKIEDWNSYASFQQSLQIFLSEAEVSKCPETLRSRTWRKVLF